MSHQTSPYPLNRLNFIRAFFPQGKGKDGGKGKGKGKGKGGRDNGGTKRDNCQIMPRIENGLLGLNIATNSRLL